jgi:hypothetical protein
MGPNSLQLKNPKQKKVKSGIRKAVGPYEPVNYKQLYASSNQAARSQASNGRVISVNSNNSSNINAGGSFN